MFKRSLALIGAIVVSLMVVACAEDHGQPPDTARIPDRVAAVDLSARYPTSERAARPAGPGRAMGSEVYGGAADAGGRVVEGPPGIQPAGGDSFTLNFEGAEVQSVVRAVLGDILKVTYTIDPRVQGNISLSSAQPVPRQDILPLLESALRFSDAVLVRDGAGYKVVPSADALGSGRVDVPGRLQSGYGLTVIPARNISAQALVQLLDNFATRPGMIRADQKRNFLVAQGTTNERRVMIEMAQALDADWMKNQAVGIFPVSNATPDTIIGEVNKILDTKPGDDETGIRLQPISRMNAVLAVARNRADINKVGAWVKRLDRADYLNTSLRVYQLRYGEAKKLAAMLNDVFTGRSGSSSLDGKSGADQLQPGSDLSGGSSGGAGFGSSGGSPQRTGQSAAASSGSSMGSGSSGRQSGGDSDPFRSAFDESGSGGGTGSSSAGGKAPLPDVRIAPDTVNNSLLIFASRENYRLIEQAILELDRPPLQVAIDVTIAEVTLTDELRYGVQYYLGNTNVGADQPFRASLSSPQSSSAAALPLAGYVPGLNLVLGSAAHPNVVLDALRGVTSVKVLSSPSLVVLDNQLAVLQVGDQIPIQTQAATYLNGSSTTTGGTTSTLNPVVNAIEYRDTGVILRVLPRINANGVVSLRVEQETSDVTQGNGSSSSANTTTTNLTPTISQRRVKSSISVTSGQTVLLGGLIKESNQEVRNGVPVLSEIPVLGNLFSHQDTTATRTELIIFIRPQIIRNSADAQMISEELRSKLEVIRMLGSRSATSAPDKRS